MLLVDNRLMCVYVYVYVYKIKYLKCIEKEIKNIYYIMLCWRLRDLTAVVDQSLSNQVIIVSKLLLYPRQGLRTHVKSNREYSSDNGARQRQYECNSRHHGVADVKPKLPNRNAN